MDAAHPFGVASCQVVVDGDDVHAIAAECVEIHGEGRDQCLSLAGLHLGHPTEVERRAAHELHVVVALADLAQRCLADHGEGLDEQVVEVCSVGQPLAELDRSVGELLVGQCLDLGFERIDVRHECLDGPEFLALTGTEEFVEDAHKAGSLPTHRGRGFRGTVLALVSGDDAQGCGRSPPRAPQDSRHRAGPAPPRAWSTRWCTRHRSRGPAPTCAGI